MLLEGRCWGNNNGMHVGEDRGERLRLILSFLTTCFASQNRTLSPGPVPTAALEGAGGLYHRHSWGAFSVFLCVFISQKLLGM